MARNIFGIVPVSPGSSTPPSPEEPPGSEARHTTVTVAGVGKGCWNTWRGVVRFVERVVADLQCAGPSRGVVGPLDTPHPTPGVWQNLEKGGVAITA